MSIIIIALGVFLICTYIAVAWSVEKHYTRFKKEPYEKEYVRIRKGHRLLTKTDSKLEWSMVKCTRCHKEWSGKWLHLDEELDRLFKKEKKCKKNERSAKKKVHKKIRKG